MSLITNNTDSSRRWFEFRVFFLGLAVNLLYLEELILILAFCVCPFTSQWNNNYEN